MKTVGVLARPGLAEAGPVLRELTDWLLLRGLEACLDEGTSDLVDGGSGPGIKGLSSREVAARSDALVVLGGDGTLLAASHLVDRPVPVLGVNFGSLGFLTEVALSELFPALESVLDGTYRYEERRMLRASVDRGGEPVLVGDALNDVVITKAAHARIIELDVSIDGLFVSAFRADGLIVSSPTGSTAYNLAAGGPILHPALPAVVLTPICPHMLTNRPFVVGDGATVEISLRWGRDVEVHITLDGQPGFALAPGDRVAVTRSPRALRLVRAPGRDYYEVLRTKLKWGEASVRRS